MSGIHWDHNAHYHDLVLNALPERGSTALDVGSGEGLLAGRLADRFDRVVAVDADPGMVAVARSRVPGTVTVLEGDALAVEPPDGGFDAITCIASLHHLGHQVGVETALKELRAKLAPGGRLVVLGLHVQPAEAIDVLQYLVARPADLAVGVYKRLRRGFGRPGGRPGERSGVQAGEQAGEHAGEHSADIPVRDADVTLPELRRVVAEVLPGAQLRRLLYWRYLLVFTEPRP